MMEKKFDYLVMQEPKPNAQTKDFIMLERYKDYDEAKIRVLRELAEGYKTYMKSVELR
tara:strand:- start:923 stop:1096 length:174 start_codon:yes stop_codon:yes gene_type:complete